MASLDELIESLLYEGYALYPYTPGATKNATPTPFGIVYPPAYAERSGATFDHITVECVAEAEPTATINAFVVFLQSSGERHEAQERRVEIEPAKLEELANNPQDTSFDFDSVRGDLHLAATAAGDGTWRVSLRVDNTTPVSDEDPGGMDRAGALAHSLISTHPVLRLSGGRFVSPLEARGCDNVNTWPVLAGGDDDAIVGAAIMLPDNPAIAPKSRGNLFDGTEIEEALLLHVHALSDDERASIAEGDPAVRAMVDRAAAVAPPELFELHGVMQPVQPARNGGPDTPAPMSGAPHTPAPERGEKEAVVNGRTVRPGAKLILRLGNRTDVYDKMLDGRVATLRRIYFDYDNKLYLGVTVDSDPMQEVLGSSGRYLFFFSNEVEVLDT